MRKIIIRRMAAIVAAAVISMAFAMPASAWHNWNDSASNIRWPNGDVSYCIFGSPSTTHTNSAIAMADRLNGYLGNIRLVYAGTGIGGAGCEISITMGSFSWFNNLATAGLVVGSDAIINDADVYINTGRFAMWQYGAVQDCYVGMGQGCLPDYRTVVMHELMHSIGFGHNRGTEDVQRCSIGFYSTGALSACDFYGEAVMYINAGVEFAFLGNTRGGYLHQGYRHEWPSEDDRNGLYYKY